MSTSTNNNDSKLTTPKIAEGDLLERAKQEDARHLAEHHRPISAETL